MRSGAGVPGARLATGVHFVEERIVGVAGRSRPVESPGVLRVQRRIEPESPRQVGVGQIRHAERDGIDPAWNPGGIWSPVRLHRTGPVRLAALRVTCREVTDQRAAVELEARLDAAAPRQDRSSKEGA